MKVFRNLLVVVATIWLGFSTLARSSGHCGEEEEEGEEEER